MNLLIVSNSRRQNKANIRAKPILIEQHALVWWFVILAILDVHFRIFNFQIQSIQVIFTCPRQQDEMQRIIRFGLLRNTALSSSGHHCFSAPFSTTNSKCQEANPSPQVDTKTRESATNSSSLTSQNPNEKVTFAKLFKESKFVALGDLSNKYLIGRIVEVIGDDLYIDYGGKFNCICKRPLNNAR